MAGWSLRLLHPRHRQALHHFDRVAREDGEVRVLLEQFRRGLVRLGLDDVVGGHVVADVGDAAGRDPLGLPERGALVDDRGLVFFHPGLPRLHAGMLLRLALRGVQRFPSVHGFWRTGKDGEEVLHGVLLVIGGWGGTSKIGAATGRKNRGWKNWRRESVVGAQSRSGAPSGKYRRNGR